MQDAEKCEIANGAKRGMTCKRCKARENIARSAKRRTVCKECKTRVNVKAVPRAEKNVGPIPSAGKCEIKRSAKRKTTWKQCQERENVKAVPAAEKNIGPMPRAGKHGNLLLIGLKDPVRNNQSSTATLCLNAFVDI